MPWLHLIVHLSRPALSTALSGTGATAGPDVLHQRLLVGGFAILQGAARLLNHLQKQVGPEEAHLPTHIAKAGGMPDTWCRQVAEQCS